MNSLVPILLVFIIFSISSSFAVDILEAVESGDITSLNDILIIFNISKMNNVISLCITAASFSWEVIVIGLTVHSKLESYINTRFPELNIMRLENLDMMKEYLHTRNTPLYGLEIIDGAISLRELAKLKESKLLKIALMPGNEGNGINITGKKVCDGFVFIPQYGNGTASLNVNVATSISIQQLSS